MGEEGLHGRGSEKIWDYVIVGTGMGGGPLGLRLAQAGFSVLFIERGKSPLDADSLSGIFAEQGMGPDKDNGEILRRAGRFHQKLFQKMGKAKKKLHPLLGQGVGGSSALYGMVLERFCPLDFQSWPISYEELLPHYEAAEKLFKVRKAYEYHHPANARLHSFLRTAGYHPYPLPLANEDHPGCGNCQSVLCKMNCKNDSGKVGIHPAVRQFGAELFTECEVLRIEADTTRAYGVQVSRNGESEFIAAKNVVISAGGLSSPELLLKSRSSSHPNGIGNDSGLVGRYLMRHFVDLYALKIDTDPHNKHSKEVGFNDLYTDGNLKLGTVQSFGRLPPVEVLLHQVKQASPKLRWLLALVEPMLKMILHFKTRDRLVMASILEDEPKFENRVWTEGGELLIHYEISKKDRDKIQRMRATLKKLFSPLGLWFLASSEKNEMLAHVCGTCRMGDDPKSSVLDSNNRIHGIENLYVVDGSFFPTSGGTNPALTIAANALRVAELIISRRT